MWQSNGWRLVRGALIVGGVVLVAVAFAQLLGLALAFGWFGWAPP